MFGGIASIDDSDFKCSFSAIGISQSDIRNRSGFKTNNGIIIDSDIVALKAQSVISNVRSLNVVFNLDFITIDISINIVDKQWLFY